MKTKHWMIAMLLPLVPLAAACSDSEDSADSGDTSSEETETTETTEAEGDAGSTDGTEGGRTDTGNSMGSDLTGDTSELLITEIAAGHPDTQTVTRLVLQAGLLSTLRDGGPFTVFAPTDAAFAEVPQATLNSLSTDKEGLGEVLTLHVVPGSLTTDDLKKMAEAGTPLETVNGGKLLIEVDGENVVVGGATIVLPDVPAKNGTVHAIDTVITAPNA